MGTPAPGQDPSTALPKKPFHQLSNGHGVVVPSPVRPRRRVRLFAMLTARVAVSRRRRKHGPGKGATRGASSASYRAPGKVRRQVPTGYPSGSLGPPASPHCQRKRVQLSSGSRADFIFLPTVSHALESRRETTTPFSLHLPIPLKTRVAKKRLETTGPVPSRFSFDLW